MDTMTWDTKKRAAAVSAVVAYIKTQEEAAMAAAQAGITLEPEVPSQPAAAAGAPVLNAWGISGRQAQMDGRFLMQMRTFR